MTYQYAPRSWLTWAELPRAFFALASLPYRWPELANAPKGDQRPILVIPGIGMTDRSTFVIRRYLGFLGYRVYGWELGRNLGAKSIGLENERLIERIQTLYHQEQQALTLIGWSMGGIMARMVARRQPDKIREVISLGAPFVGDPFASRAWEIYERLSGHSLKEPVAQAQIAESKLPLPVSACSFYSQSDGVVAWQACLEPNTPDARSIPVRSAHCSFGFSAVVLMAIANRLAATSLVPVHCPRQRRAARALA